MLVNRNIYLLFSILSIFICLLDIIEVNAQETPGLSVGNYTGIHALQSNPSAAIYSAYWLDFNIIGLEVFACNNGFYIPRSDFNVTDLLRRDYVFPTYGKYNRSFLTKGGTFMRNFFTQNRVLLPSAMVVDITRGLSVGLLLQSREAASGDCIPYDIANFGYYGLEHKAQHNIEYNDYNIYTAGLVWTELGVNIGRTLKRERFDLWAAGITLKYLWGHSGYFARIDNVRYVVLNDSTMDIRNLDAKAGFSLAIDYRNNDFPGPEGYTLGHGFSFDLGITFIKTNRELRRLFPGRLCEARFEPYVFRLGLSLLDIGSIRFSRNAQKHVFDGVSHFWEHARDFTYTTVDEAVNDISNRFYGNPTASLNDTSFTVGLPTAFSIQFDYHLNEKYYVHAMAIQAFPILGEEAVKRANVIYVMPRYETPAFEIGIPLSLYRYRIPRLGFWFRIYSFTLGTDNLGMFLRTGDFNNADIYLSLRIPLRKGKCLKSKGKLPCESF